jgi:hypothetical protein
MTDESQKLAAILESMASAIGAHPAPIIGQSISVTAAPGQRGDVIGMRVEVIAGQGAHGAMIGNYVSVSAGGRSLAEVDMMQELRDAAAKVRDNHAPKSWVTGLIQRAASLGNAAVTAAMVAAATDGVNKLLS